MAQWLRVFAAFPEDPGSVCNSHVRHLSVTLAPRDPRPSFGLLGYTYIKNENNSLDESRTGTIAQWLKRLLHMPEDWSLDPQNPSKCWVGGDASFIPIWTKVASEIIHISVLWV